MNTKILCFAFFAIAIMTACNQNKQKTEEITSQEMKLDSVDHPILGRWIRNGPGGATAFEFKKDGLVEADLGNDSSIDLIASYKMKNDTIYFVDKAGKMCKPGSGVYKVYQTEYYASFDLIDDNCNGRIKTTMGFWTRPNFEELLEKLDKEIANSSKSEAILSRARINLAIGNATMAKSDFDAFIESDTTNARVYINRAGTRFPFDMSGVVSDCNKAIALDKNQKNAYFLRGLALYELGEKENACKDFEKAIELGFSILRIAEQTRCAEYWLNEG